MTDYFIPELSVDELRDAIKAEYSVVASNPDKGFHFLTGKIVAERHGYDPEWYANIPEDNMKSFAGTGNPFIAGEIKAGETVVDIGSGAGLDALIAAAMVGPGGRVVGIDMTDEMLEKARDGAAKMGYSHVEFKKGYMEKLPLPDDFADVIISNGVLNLTLNKLNTLRGWFRILKPGARLQIGDIILSRKVPEASMGKIELWTG